MARVVINSLSRVAHRRNTRQSEIVLNNTVRYNTAPGRDLRKGARAPPDIHPNGRVRRDRSSHIIEISD